MTPGRLAAVKDRGCPPILACCGYRLASKNRLPPRPLLAAAAAAETIPSTDPAAPVERATPVNRDEATDTSAPPEAGAGSKPVASDDKVQRDNGDVRASDALPGGK